MYVEVLEFLPFSSANYFGTCSRDGICALAKLCRSSDSTWWFKLNMFSHEAAWGPEHLSRFGHAGSGIWAHPPYPGA